MVLHKEALQEDKPLLKLNEQISRVQTREVQYVYYFKKSE